MQEIVEQAIKYLVKNFSVNFADFHGIYLYGLFLDGRLHKDEDIELVAIFDKEDKFKREVIWPIVGKIETDLDVYIDLNPTTMDNLRQDEEFYEEVMKGKFYAPLSAKS